MANMVVDAFSPEDNRTFTFLGEWRRGIIPEMDHLVLKHKIANNKNLPAIGVLRSGNANVRGRWTHP